MESNAAVKVNDTVSSDDQAMLDAINTSFAVIEFDPDGVVQTANQAFCRALGYELSEIQNKHHRMFVDQMEASSLEYRRFWDDLRAGREQTREFKRVTKQGRPIWIKASYMPVRDRMGKVVKVVKLAQDATADRLRVIDMEGQLAAISKSQAVIEFNLDGTVVNANDNFLAVLGYTLGDIQGKHHRMFVPEADRTSNEYRAFWERLNRGEFDAGRYRRVGKGGKEVWIQASYNPIFDISGKPCKVVKYATDITSDVNKMNIIAELAGSATELGTAAQQLNEAAAHLTSSASKTTSEANSATTSADEVARGVRTVATNTEEMAASIKEIARNANDASTATNTTVRQAEATNVTIGKLGESSQEIGNVVKVISSIAQQTNLLALNATIEAARAGDAGRGFAVVANEVKELAKQTAKATEEITSKIGAIQRDTNSAVGAIGAIGESIKKLNGIATSIAASVEEQQATTNEVARVVQDSSQGVSRIASNIKTVTAVSNETSIGAGQVLEAAKKMSKIAEVLQQLVKRVQT